MSTADLTLYIATSTVFLTALIGFVIPESAAYTQHNQQRLVTQAAMRQNMAIDSSVGSAIQALAVKIQGMQEVQNTMAARLGAVSISPNQTPMQQ